MRSEQEMMDLILTFAEHDGCIRAVAMCGSRMNEEPRRKRRGSSAGKKKSRGLFSFCRGCPAII
jgi:hypothetical protein